MPIIGLCPYTVEEYEALEREDFPRPGCPRCGGRTTFNGSYRPRWREDVWDWESGEGRDVEGEIGVRRVHCLGCGHGPGVLPSFLFGRRRDLSEVIVRALLRWVGGSSLARVPRRRSSERLSLSTAPRRRSCARLWRSLSAPEVPEPVFPIFESGEVTGRGVDRLMFGFGET